MRLKKMLFIMALLTMVGRASSQVSFSVDPVTIAAGENEKELSINVNLMGTYKACQFDLILPEGVSIRYDEEDNEKILRVGFVKLGVNEDHTVASSNPEVNKYRFVVSSLNNRNLTTGERGFLTITLQADANAALGVKTAKIIDGIFSISDTESTEPDDYEFNITVQSLPTVTLNVSLNPSNFTYDGSVQTPTVTVTAADNTTITEADYELCGDLSATNAGTYTITATPKGNYSGSAVSANWSIEASTTIDDNGNTITEDGINVTLESASNNGIAEDGGLTVLGDITQISNTAFSSIDKSGVEYVDLSKTIVSGVTVDRQSGVFDGFSDNTIIYVPSGNTAATGETNVVVDGTCQELNLSEGQGMVIPTGFTASKVTYARPLTVEKASTFCLPYSLTSDETLGFYELSSSTADALIFSEVTSTKPNKPYLAIPKIAGATFGKSISTAISSNKNLDGAEQSITGFKMIGTMKGISHADALNKFILQDDNKWHQVTSASATAAAIGAYRAFIERTAPGGSARQYSVAVDADGTTAIKTLQTIDVDGTERWYDLNGHRLQGKPTQKGTYIVNGKKVVK